MFGDSFGFAKMLLRTFREATASLGILELETPMELKILSLFSFSGVIPSF